VKLQHKNISDSPDFNGEAGLMGYDLNRMCHSFLLPENCKKFKDFPEAYCHAFNLNKEEIQAVTDLDVLRMLKAGGDIAYLIKLTDIYDLEFYDLGAQQVGKSLPEFKGMVRALGK
jgi:protocatechuate 4,5-dioxygenase, alpha chain